MAACYSCIQLSESRLKLTHGDTIIIDLILYNKSKNKPDLPYVESQNIYNFMIYKKQSFKKLVNNDRI